MMVFESKFDRALKRADKVIENTFGAPYVFSLIDEKKVTYQCIFDTQLLTQNAAGETSLKKMKYGILKVLNSRIDKSLVVDAEVMTQLGPRRVTDVIYPDETCSALILTSLKEPQRINSEYGF